VCGLTGVLHLDGESASPALVRRMSDTIAHRGPDGVGLYTDGPFAVGHRRLAVIDVTPGGHQPMSTPDGDLVLAYNGEIYNYQELRAQLQARGHRFHSQSDTEVLLHAWQEWRTDALARLNGMFAFAIWDARRRELTLARDRFGVKPLYVSQRGDVLLFGSEIKAMLAHPALRADLDPVALVEYLTFQNFFSDRTLFAGVSLLPAGSYLTASVASSHVGRPARYADVRFAEPGPGPSDDEYAEELDRLFRRAVSRQLVSDVPVSAYLSGGLDSGSVTAVAAAQLPHLKTFTVGFDLHSASGMEMGFDERERSELMSYAFGTEHYEMVLKAGDMERVMPSLVWHLEEPRVGQSYPNFYAAQLASRFGKVVLSGAGGDELFGGYPWRYYRAVVNTSFDDYVGKYYQFWQRLIGDAEPADVFRPIWRDVEDVDARAIMREVFDPTVVDLGSAEGYVNQSLYFEAKTFLHGLLVVEDKLSMAHGLETRVPFLDNDLADFAGCLPVHCKLGNLGEVVRLNENEPGSKTQRFFDKTKDGKLLLRQVMDRYLPAGVSSGVKQGFSAPDASWFRGESIDYVRRTLVNRDARIYAYVDHDAVGQLVDDHLAGRSNRRLLIWSLLYLEEWCRIFLDGEAVDRRDG
jgi:asparagine synthase (glutamine-hydrolysing)